MKLSFLFISVFASIKFCCQLVLLMWKRKKAKNESISFDMGFLLFKS